MRRYAKPRVDALTDGVFAFAMTLLVLDVRLPERLSIASAQDLTAHLLSLGHETLTYLISFFVLGAFWRGAIEARPSEERTSRQVVNVSLALLFFVTLVPFSSGLVGRYGHFTPAILVYCGNMAGLAILTIAVRHFDVEPHQRSLRAAMGNTMPLFLFSVAVALVLGVVAPHFAMYAFFVNFLGWLLPVRGYDSAPARLPPGDGPH